MSMKDWGSLPVRSVRCHEHTLANRMAAVPQRHAHGTAGLDSSNAARVVDVLAALTGRQRTGVLLTVHQPRPDVLAAMRRLLLLSGTGQARPSYCCTAEDLNIC